MVAMRDPKCVNGCVVLNVVLFLVGVSCLIASLVVFASKGDEAVCKEQTSSTDNVGESDRSLNFVWIEIKLKKVTAKVLSTEGLNLVC